MSAGIRVYLVIWDEAEGDKDYRFIETNSGARSFITQLVASGNKILRDEAIIVPTDRTGLIEFLNMFESRVNVRFDEVA